MTVEFCTICEIREFVKENNKSFSDEKIELMSRNIYNDMKEKGVKFQSTTDNDKAKETSTMGACISKKQDEGLNEEQARLACGKKNKSESKSKSSKAEKVSKNEQLPALSSLLQPVKNATLMEIKKVYKAMRSLEYTPISLYKDVKAVEAKIREYDDQIWNLESKYKQSQPSYEAARQDIMVAKIQAQSELKGLLVI
jgi:hypothetical protein